MYIERHTLALTTDVSGNATGYTPVVRGRVLDVQYVPDGTNPYTNTVDVTITGETTGKSVLAVSNVAAAFLYAPREPTHTTAGAAALYAAAGTAINDKIPIVDERVKIVLAQGGATKTGIFYVTVDGSHS